ncbi:uncharacterized protein METZ01_LOCUS402871, partial [marine metagenome]
YCNNCSVTLTDLNIKNNFGDSGAGIWCSNSTGLFLNNLLITENYTNSETSDGGGIYFYQSVKSILNGVTISNNRAGHDGGGIYGRIDGEQLLFDLTIINSIVSGNINNDGNMNNLYFDLGNNSVADGVEITYSLVENLWNWWEGEGNIDADPLFCDPENGAYSLAENSPCIDAGDPNSPLDPDGTIADMGAFGIGCEAINLAPVLLDIAFDQQIYEDDSFTIVVSATSVINASMSFTATSDTSDVSVTMDSTTLTATPAQDWNGSSLITVIVIDENELSDTT